MRLLVAPGVSPETDSRSQDSSHPFTCASTEPVAFERISLPWGLVHWNHGKLDAALLSESRGIRSANRRESGDFDSDDGQCGVMTAVNHGTDPSAASAGIDIELNGFRRGKRRRNPNQDFGVCDRAPALRKLSGVFPGGQRDLILCGQLLAKRKRIDGSIPDERSWERVF
jgi:hypothetical protein